MVSWKKRVFFGYVCGQTGRRRSSVHCFSRKKSNAELGTTQCTPESGHAGIQCTGKLAILLVRTLKRDCGISEDADWEALAIRSRKVGSPLPWLAPHLFNPASSADDFHRSPTSPFELCAKNNLGRNCAPENTCCFRSVGYWDYGFRCFRIKMFQNQEMTTGRRYYWAGMSYGSSSRNALASLEPAPSPSYGPAWRFQREHSL